MANALMRDCARGTVGNVHAIDARVLQQSNRIERLLGVDTFRRQHFNRGDKLAADDLSCPVGTFFRRNDLDIGGYDLLDAAPVDPKTSPFSAPVAKRREPRRRST